MEKKSTLPLKTQKIIPDGVCSFARSKVYKSVKGVLVVISAVFWC